MQNIKLEKLDRIEFAKELKNLKLNEEMNFEITNALAKNFEIFGYYMVKKQIKKITLDPNDNLDLLIKRKFTLHLQQYFIYYSKHFTIQIPNLLDDELIIILGQRNYLNYCSKLNLTPKWNENFLKREKRRIEDKKDLLKYEEFKDCIKLLELFPFSQMNFPTEKGKDRFVFYFYMYDEKQKQILLDFIKKHNLEKYELLTKLIIENKINEEIYYYAFGFSFKEEKLIRFTLYTKFEPELLKENKLNEFILKKHDFQINKNFKNIWYYAIDFYYDHIEYKFYDEPYQFDLHLKNNEINSVLKNKRCVKVSKYNEGKIIDEKYEFEIQKYFTDEEKKILNKNELYDSKNQILAIYIKEEEIIHKVFYNL